MKWIKVVDPTREVPAGIKMRKFLYDAIRELAIDGTVRDVEALSRVLQAAVEEGRLRTKCDVWSYCKRYYVPWLKEQGFIITDRPYAPRPWQRHSWHLWYEFASLSVVEKSKLSPGLRRLTERYAGRSMTERAMHRELSAEPSPKGARTMWKFFREHRRELVETHCLRLFVIQDPLILMQIEMEES